MRELTAHKVTVCNESLAVVVHDEPGHGGACHRYSINRVDEATAKMPLLTAIQFQDGPIKEAGVNGVTHEALLAILIDRMEGFQGGQYACFENERALNHLREAMGWLHHRTAKRLARGVEGTHKK